MIFKLSRLYYILLKFLNFFIVTSPYELSGETPDICDSNIGTTGKFALPDHENEGRCYRLNAGLDCTGGSSRGKTFMNSILRRILNAKLCNSGKM
jgi:hypothetical protein